MCLCETKCQGAGIAPFRGAAANLPEEVSRDMGYRSDSIAISRNMGLLSSAGAELSKKCSTLLALKVYKNQSPIFEDWVHA